MLENKKVQLNIKDSIATVVLNRPKKLNALDGEMWVELNNIAKEIKSNPEIKVAIITGEGQGFCAGMDIQALSSPEGLSLNTIKYRNGYELIEYLGNVIAEFEKIPVPVLAAINGECIGVGLELALACDIRLAADNSSFSIPEVTYGIIPDCGGTQKLPQTVSLSRAKELIFTGKKINAKQAFQINLIDHIYPVDQLMEETLKLAKEIVVKPVTALLAVKKALNMSTSINSYLGLNYERALADRVLVERQNNLKKKHKRSHSSSK